MFDLLNDKRLKSLADLFALESTHYHISQSHKKTDPHNGGRFYVGLKCLVVCCQRAVDNSIQLGFAPFAVFAERIP